MSASAVDDVVLDWNEAQTNGREPLLMLKPLRRFLDERGLGSGDLRTSPVGDGRSNVIYRIERDDIDVVLRRPPRGPLPPSAHDVLREARILEAPAGTGPRLPVVRAVCDDEAVIGAPFYVMSASTARRSSRRCRPHSTTAQAARRSRSSLAQGLAELHAVDWRSMRLGERPPRSPYVDRQLRRFGGLWEHNRTRETEDVDAVAGWLERNRPAASEETVVHGDYRLPCTRARRRRGCSRSSTGRWRRSAIRSPTSATCARCGSRPALPTAACTKSTGSPEETVSSPAASSSPNTSARASARSTTCGSTRSSLCGSRAIFMEGNYKRATSGLSGDPYLNGFAEGVLGLARRARERAEWP